MRKIKIIQVLPTINYGDAVSNDALNIYNFLKRKGYKTLIYAENIDKKLKDKVEKIENLKKQRDELREKLKSQNNGEYGTIPLDDKQSNNKEIENDTGGKTGKIKEMLVVVLSALAVVIIIIIAITAFRIKNESMKVSEKIENKQAQEEKTEKEADQKSDIEVVVSTPQTPGTATQGTGQNSSDPNVVIPQTPVLDAVAQGNQQAKPEEEIKKGTEYYTKSTKGPVNIRKTSSKNSPIQDELPDGVVLKFIGKEGKWYRVSYTVNNQTKEGFVHVSQIKKK